MAWRQALGKCYPLRRQPGVYEGAIEHSAVTLCLQEEYEPHVAAQGAFWSTVLGFLARHGKLMYEQPNYDQPRYSTGPMALEPIELDDGGEARIIPCIQVTCAETDLVWGYFLRQSESWRNMVRWMFAGDDSEKRRQEVFNTMLRYFESRGTNDPHFPYVEMEARALTYAGQHTGRVHYRTTPIEGAYVPRIRVDEAPLPIFPETPPPNYKEGYGYTTSWVRLGHHTCLHCVCQHTARLFVGKLESTVPHLQFSLNGLISSVSAACRICPTW